MTAASYRDGVSLRNGLRAIGQSFVFQGRATRSELTSALILAGLAEALLFLVIHFFHPPTAPGLTVLWRRVAFEQSLALLPLVPLIGIGVRRLHDVGVSAVPGILLALIALASDLNQQLAAIGLHEGIPMPAWAGPIALLILAVALFWSPSAGANRFGPDPRTR